MVLTNGQIYQLYETLMSLKEEKFPIRAGYTILRDIQTLQPFYQDIITIRNDIVTAVGDPDENGNVTIPNDQIDEVNNQLAELTNIENNVELKKISLNDIGSFQMQLEILEHLAIIIDELGQ